MSEYKPGWKDPRTDKTFHVLADLYERLGVFPQFMDDYYGKVEPLPALDKWVIGWIDWKHVYG